MNIFENVFAYETKEGRKGIVRADDKGEAIERINDYWSTDKVKYIFCLTDLDNDYGVVEQKLIDKALADEKRVRQISFDIITDIDFDYENYEKLETALEEAGFTVLGSAWKATWKLGDYEVGKAPIDSD